MKPLVCNEDIRVLVSSCADGQVTPEEERRAKSHLAGCADCRARVEEWTKLTELFQWANTKDLPEVEIMAVTEGTSQPHPAAGLAGTLREKFFPRRRWAFSCALATVVVMAVAAGLMMRPPVLTASARTGAEPRVVRLETGVHLEIAPNSTVTRMGDNWVRLESGSVRATVKHGERRFRIQSPRLDTWDLGTRFTVATGPRGDVVTVEKGSVSVHRAKTTETVRAGQALLALDGRAPVVLTSPSLKSGEGDIGTPIYEPVEQQDSPHNIDELDWRDGARRLYERYADLPGRLGGSTWSSTTGNLHTRFALYEAAGLRAALQEGFGEISLGLVGARMPESPWEITVGYLQVSGIDEPVSMPADLYVLRLRNHGGQLVWRLEGSLGTEANLPVQLSEPEYGPEGQALTDTGILVPPAASQKQVKIVLAEWPGPTNPMLRFTLRGTPLAEKDPAAARMREEGARQLGLNPDNVSYNLLYLDPERRHRLVTVWDTQAASRMARHLRGDDRQGRAETIGAIVTDAEWSGPHEGHGETLMLRWEQDHGGGKPSFAVSPPPAGGSFPIYPLPTAPKKGGASTGAGHGGWGGNSVSLPPPGGNGASDTLHFEYMGPANGVFRFRVRVTPAGAKEDESPWGEGWFSIKRP